MVNLHTLQEIDRIFYEYLRLKVVELGYLPDKLLYANKQAYDTARKGIKLSGKELIDVFGHSTEENRGETTLNRFVVCRLTSEAGSMGGSPATYFERYTDALGKIKFRHKYYPEQSRNLNYEVRLICGSGVYDSLMSGIIDEALGYRRYLKTILPDRGVSLADIFVERNGEVDISGCGYIERIYRYEANDVFVQAGELIRENIPVLNTIDYGIFVRKSNEDLI